ncbi:MAG: ACT domain-containing protein [Phycisphaerae bacterium]
MSDPPDMENGAVRSATLKRDVRRVTVRRVPHEPGVAAKIFSEIGRRNINVDDIIQGVSDSGRTVTISFMVDAKQADAARAVAERTAQRFAAAEVEVSEELARLRVVGIGMRAHSGVAARLFEALAAENINIENISTSEVVISILVPEQDGERALQAAHRTFQLEQDPP